MSTAHVRGPAARHFRVEPGAVDVLAGTFFATVVVLGLYAMWTLDGRGLRFGVSPPGLRHVSLIGVIYNKRSD